LVFSVFFWVLFGWLADYSFPFGQALELLLSCFKGTVGEKINNLQQQLQRTEIIPQPDNVHQIQKLNNLESQAWLYKSILEYFAVDGSANHQKIAMTLEALEYKRSQFLQELEPRRPQNYRILLKIQNSVRDLLTGQAEKDYEELYKVMTNLVLFTKNRQRSQVILSEIVTKLSFEVQTSASKISPYRLRLAYKVNELLKVLSDKLILNINDPTATQTYQSLLIEKNQRIKHLSNELEGLRQSQSTLQNYISELESQTINLNQQINELSKSKKATERVANQTEISESQYNEITNKDDYERVRGHERSGKWVNPYYRRKRNR